MDSRTPAPVFADDERVLPEGSHVDGAAQLKEAQDVADYVVIGSGASGATAAWVLSEAGYSVIILEEGPWIRTKAFGQDVFPGMKKMIRGAGGHFVAGKATFPILQGRCVGGGTTVNSAIALRPPERVIDEWSRDYGLNGSITNENLERQFDAIENELSVRPVGDDALGEQNRVFGEAAAQKGIRAKRATRYDGGCEGSASCLTGCRGGKKMSTAISYVPRSLQKGAKIYHCAKVLRVTHEYGRATGVEARFLSERGTGLYVHARRGVIVAASAVQSPAILRRSGIKLPAVGQHFQAHLGTSVTARLGQNISMHVGATQGFNSIQFVEQDRFKIETLSLPPELLMLRLPGVGSELMRKMLDYQSVMNVAVVARAKAEGRVRSGLGREFVFYQPSTEDMSRVRQGMKTLSEIFFEAGAKEIWPMIHGVSPLKSPDDLKQFDSASLDARDYSLMISHLFGSNRMGPEASSSVVGLDFQVHGTRGLYVLDSSVFPTNLGVNPQHTIMAVARLGATSIVERPLPVLGFL